MSRVIVWFSCGAASAVAAKLAVKKYGKENLHVVYCDTRSEHPSNAQFLLDVQEWIDHPIETIYNAKYKNHFDVFRKERFLIGPHGAPCTGMLKKRMRYEYQKPDDIHVFGYTADETKRIKRFKVENFELNLDFILEQYRVTKSICLALLQRERECNYQQCTCLKNQGRRIITTIALCA